MTVWPNGTTTKPTSTSGWGWYDPYDTGEPEFHYGDDEIGFDWNCAPEAGVIVYASFNGAAGNDIRLASDRDGTIFRMLHNASLDGVYAGRRYAEAEQIAPQGNTSTERIRRHTHLEVWPLGNINNRVDPVPWMQARIGSSPAGGRPLPLEEKETDMKDHILLEIANQDGSHQWALISPDLKTFVPIWKTETANALSKRIADGTGLKSAILAVAKGEWNEFRKAAGLGPDLTVG